MSSSTSALPGTLLNYRSSPLSRNIPTNFNHYLDTENIDMLAETRNRRKTLSASHTPLNPTFTPLTEEEFSVNLQDGINLSPNANFKSDRRHSSWTQKFNFLTKSSNKKSSSSSSPTTTSGSISPDDAQQFSSSASANPDTKASISAHHTADNAFSLNPDSIISKLSRKFPSNSTSSISDLPLVNSSFRNTSMSKADSEPPSPTGKSGKNGFWRRNRSASLKDLRNESKVWEKKMQQINTKSSISKAEISPTLQSSAHLDSPPHQHKTPSLVDKADVDRKKPSLMGSINTIGKRLSIFTSSSNNSSSRRHTSKEDFMKPAVINKSKSEPVTPSRALSPKTSIFTMGKRKNSLTETQISSQAADSMSNSAKSNPKRSLAGLNMTLISSAESKSASGIIRDQAAIQPQPDKADFRDNRQPSTSQGESKSAAALDTQIEPIPFSPSSAVQDSLVLIDSTHCRQINLLDTPSTSDYAMQTSDPDMNVSPAISSTANAVESASAIGISKEPTLDKSLPPTPQNCLSPSLQEKQTPTDGGVINSIDRRPSASSSSHVVL